MRCIWADHAVRQSWPWPYCRTCTMGPKHGLGGAFTPYFAPNLKKTGEWDCADRKTQSKRGKTAS